MSSEALQQLCKENTQILPWIWVIEALASSKFVDTSLLLQLARKIPDKYGEMGENAREAVLLRILEGLAARDDEENGSVSDTGERIQFDPSESCKDVLQHILEDAQASDVENGRLKMLKWDVQSFIAGKRARLNTSFLQKLKDAILEGSHSVIESLKERSGIAQLELNIITIYPRMVATLMNLSRDMKNMTKILKLLNPVKLQISPLLRSVMMSCRKMYPCKTFYQLREKDLMLVLKFRKDKRTAELLQKIVVILREKLPKSISRLRIACGMIAWVLR